MINYAYKIINMSKLGSRGSVLLSRKVRAPQGRVLGNAQWG